MPRDIDVDPNELEKFIRVLQQFQDTAEDKLKAVQLDWSRCDESWQGNAKEEFTRGFEQTESSVMRALDAGEKAIRWLQKFHEIVEEMERRR